MYRYFDVHHYRARVPACLGPIELFNAWSVDECNDCTKQDRPGPARPGRPQRSLRRIVNQETKVSYLIAAAQHSCTKQGKGQRGAWTEQDGR